MTKVSLLPRQAFLPNPMSCWQTAPCSIFHPSCLWSFQKRWSLLQNDLSADTVGRHGAYLCWKASAKTATVTTTSNGAVSGWRTHKWGAIMPSTIISIIFSTKFPYCVGATLNENSWWKLRYLAKSDKLSTYPLNAKTSVSNSHPWKWHLHLSVLLLLHKFFQIIGKLYRY